MADGLIVPFALAAGLSGAVDSTAIIITAGLAEIAAGSIAMGLGGYLAAHSDSEHYASERAREQREIETVPNFEIQEVAEMLETYGVEPKQSTLIASEFILCDCRDLFHALQNSYRRKLICLALERAVCRDRLIA